VFTALHDLYIYDDVRARVCDCASPVAARSFLGVDQLYAREDTLTIFEAVVTVSLAPGLCPFSNFRPPYFLTSVVHCFLIDNR